MKKTRDISSITVSHHALARFRKRYRQRVGALPIEPKSRLRELMCEVEELPSQSKLIESIKHGSWGRHFIRREDGFYCIFVTNPTLTRLLTVVLKRRF